MSRMRLCRGAGGPAARVAEGAGLTGRVVEGSVAGGAAVFSNVMGLAANRGAAMVAHAVTSAPRHACAGGGLGRSLIEGISNIGASTSASVGNAASQARARLSSGGGGGGSAADYLPQPSASGILSRSEHWAELQATGSAYAAVYGPVAGLRTAVGCLSILGGERR